LAFRLLVFSDLDFVSEGPEQKSRYGTMATPFLIDESVLAFEQQQLDGDHDLSHFLTVDEEDILAMHALALEIEKREAGKQHSDLANIQIQSQ